MKTIIMDTSTNLLYVSFIDGDVEIFKKIMETKNNHSENLLNVIKKGLEETKLEIKNFQRIIVGIGPGSYTGLRVSVTIAKMFSWTLNIPLYTISSLDIVASGYYNEDGIYAITNIAKKDYLYTKIVNIKNGKYNALSMDNFILAEEFFQEIKGKDYKVINIENFSFNPQRIIDLATKKIEDVHALVPNYLRKANT